jgi:hypothetical protein
MCSLLTLPTPCSPLPIQEKLFFTQNNNEMSSKDINLKLAEEAMALQAKIGVGIVDADMFAEFASKFPGFFSEKFHLIMGPGKADNKECSFGDMMGVAKKVFDAIKNKSIKHVVTPVDDNTMSVQMIFDSVYLDAHGDEIAGTEGVYEFTTLLTYNADHKIVSWNQTWDTARMDNMRELEKEANHKIFERNKVLFSEILGAWGSGAFNTTNPDAKKVAEKFMAEDCVTDARYNTANSTGFKVYDGREGCLEWCAFLEKTWAMPDYSILGVYEGPKGECWATGSASPLHIPTGKQMPFPCEFIYRVGFDKEGKCTYFKFYNSGAFVYMDSLVSENEAVVAQMIPFPERPVADKVFAKNLETFWGNMQAWGSGVYNGPKGTALETIEKFWAKDCVVDFRYPMNTTSVLDKPFKGPEGIFEWCQILAGWDMPDFDVQHVVECNEGEILALFQFTNTVKATGKLVGNYDCVFRCSVVNGKIAHATMHQGPGAVALDAAHTPDANKFFIVEHEFRSPEKAEEWWKNTAELFSDAEKLNATNKKQFELGFVFHQFLPQAAGTDKKMQCLWECKNTVTKEEFQQFIDGPYGPDATDCVINHVSPAMQGAILPGTKFFLPYFQAAPEHPIRTKGSFFWVKHDFKSPESAGEFWNAMGSLDFKAITAKNNKLGFHNHTFVPVAPEGPMFCLWESDKDISVEEFQTFVDGPDGPSPALINHVHKTDLSAAAVPNAKFSVPVEGAVLPLKEVPDTAAVTANQAMAA